ncbi:MAG: hypothetical protein ACE5NN_02045 [Candidatus Bathyarchaeia archaeon]
MRVLTVSWAVNERQRLKPFTEAMEAASILCLADSERRRPSIMRSRGEEITHLSKLHYPFWAVPHGERCLIIDGLNISSDTISVWSLPDVKSFTEDLKQASRDFDIYRKVISRHTETFKDFKSASEVHIQALIGDKEILEVILELLSQEMHSEELLMEGLSPLLRLDKRDAVERSEAFLDVWKSNLSDIEALRYAINVLNEEMERHREKTMTEIEELQKRYEMKILELRPLVKKKIDRLMKERKSKIKKALKDQEKRLGAALKDQDKLEREMMRLEKRIENYLARKRTRGRRDASQLDVKIEICQNRMKETARRIEVISRIAETIRMEGDETVKTIEDDYEKMIEKEREKVEHLEASMEAETSELRKEIEDPEAEASSIISQIEHLLKRKEMVIDELKGTTVPAKVEEAILIRIPFYVARYKAGERERLKVFPPVVAVRRGGFVLKLKRAIKPTLGSRIRLLLHPRWDFLEQRVFAKFEEKLHEDASLMEEVNRAVELNNLLEASHFKDGVVAGTSELMKDGWITGSERKQMLDEYAS